MKIPIVLFNLVHTDAQSNFSKQLVGCRYIQNAAIFGDAGIT